MTLLAGQGEKLEKKNPPALKPLFFSFNERKAWFVLVVFILNFLSFFLFFQLFSAPVILLCWVIFPIFISFLTIILMNSSLLSF